jgi:ABC-type glycerol-3-phosphate transport system substrate-binding protein
MQAGNFEESARSRRKNMKRSSFKFLLALCTVAACLFIDGIAWSGGQGDKSGAVTTIEFFHSKTNIMDVLQKIIDDYHKENPAVTFEQNTAPDYFQVLQTRMASGKTPALFSTWLIPSFYIMADEGHVLELTGDSCLSNIQDVVLMETAHKGKTWCAPLAYNTFGIYYNVL